MKMNAYTLQRTALDIAHLPQYDLKRYQILPKPQDNNGVWSISYDTTSGQFIWPKDLPALCQDMQRMAAHYKSAGFDVTIAEKMTGTPNSAYPTRRLPVLTVKGEGGDEFMAKLRRAYLSALEEGAVSTLEQSLSRAIDGYAEATQLDSRDRFTQLSSAELQAVLQKAASRIVTGYIAAHTQPGPTEAMRSAGPSVQSAARSVTARL